MGDSTMKQERIPRLDPCWPVLPGPRYRGVVWHHPRLRDGTMITTSAVVELKGGRIVTRSGSTYELGRTFFSEQHAVKAVGRAVAATHPMVPVRETQELPVLDLESDDISGLDTFAHDELPELR